MIQKPVEYQIQIDKMKEIVQQGKEEIQQIQIQKQEEIKKFNFYQEQIKQIQKQNQQTQNQINQSLEQHSYFLNHKEQTIEKNNQLQLQVNQKTQTNESLSQNIELYKKEIEKLKKIKQQREYIKHQYLQSQKIEESLQKEAQQIQKEIFIDTVIKQDEERKFYQNEYLNALGNIRVMIKVRPINIPQENYSFEIQKVITPRKIEELSRQSRNSYINGISVINDVNDRSNLSSISPFVSFINNDDTNIEEGGTIEYEDDKSIRIKMPQDQKNEKGRNYKGTYEYSFNHIFKYNAVQEQVFYEVETLIMSCLDGDNVCIFAYGQTGSGKTYTMFGNPLIEQSKGIVFRAVNKIYNQIEKNKLTIPDKQISVQMKVIEIYNNQVNNLIRKEENDQYYIQANNYQEVTEQLKKAMEKRKQEKTDMNEYSSRSHLLFSLQIKTHDTVKNEVKYSTITLVDLAGSERLKQSKVEGIVKKETEQINLSLLCLKKVINSLINKNKHIPYNESKLTTVLQNDLGGNSKTLMVVCVSARDEDYHQSQQSLEFAKDVGKSATKSVKD